MKFVACIFFIPLALVAAAQEKTLSIAQEQPTAPRSFTSKPGMIRLENEEKISYLVRGEYCAKIKLTGEYLHCNKKNEMRTDLPFCANRFATLKKWFESSPC